MATAGKRRSDSDVLKLIESNYEVNLNNGLNKFTVKFHGPPNTLYENGVWKIRVELTERYPFEPPVICFLNKIYHPNIDEVSGNVCLDVLNQKWSAMFDLINIFESFLPQLLTYPNSKDPLNSEAGIMYEEDLQAYENRVRDYINRYATESSLVTTTDDDNKRFRGTPQESPASPKPEPTTPPPETEGDHYSSESSMSDDDDDDDDAKSDHEDATAGSSAGRNKAFGSNEPKEPPSATITSPPFDDDESTIEDDQYLEHFNYVHSFDEAKD